MPYITVTGGLTLQVPTRTTTDWDEVFLSEFAQKISEHDHTGSGRGSQLGTGALVDSAVDDRKVRLRNAQALRARNAAGSADIDTFKVNASDEFVMEVDFHADRISNKSTFTMVNNQSVAADVTGVTIDSSADVIIKIVYAAERLGTADLREHGLLEIQYNGTDFDVAQEFVGDAGLAFTVTAGGQLQYTTTDNTGSSSEKLHYQILTIGD